MAPPKFLHYAQVIPAGYYAIAFEHSIAGAPDKQICTIGVGAVGYVLTPADLTDLANAWKEHIIDTLASNATEFTRVTASDADGVVLEEDRTDVGTNVENFCPVSVAAIVEKRTGVSGRAHRGRLFLPMVPEAEVDEAGRLDIDFRDGVQTDFEAFQTAVNATMGTAELVLLHSKGWGTPEDPEEDEPADPGNAPAPDVITSWAVKQIIGTQRRRLR